MELRKNPDIDLERKRPMFLSIGLLVSLSLVLTAFQWKVEKAVVEIWEPEEEEDYITMIDPIVTYMDQPKKPKVEIPKKKIVSIHNIVATLDETEIIKEDEVLIVDDEKLDDLLTGIEEPIEEEDTDVVFDIVETDPSPIGGMQAFYKHLSKEMKYPRMARRMSIEGKVFVQFIIDQTGAITNAQVIKGIGGGCDEEAVRVVSNSPAWSPGKQRGVPVKVRMIVPVVFQLN